MSFKDRKRRLMELQQRVLTLAREASASSFVLNLDGDLKKLSEEKFHLVLLGQFKRGKTTLINAVLGEHLLPTAVVPLTSILTLIRYGDKRCVHVIFDHGGQVQIDSLALDQYVTERGNPNNEKRVRYVEIQHPSGFLRGGIVLIDTPGIGSLFLHNTTTTYKFIPNIDAAIFLLSADLPMTQTEYQFLEDVRKQVGKIFFVMNKIDIISPAELDEAVEYNLRVLRKQIGKNNITLFPLSARIALEERIQNNSEILPLSRFTDFENALLSFLENEKSYVLLQASEQRTRNCISGLRFALDLELKANEIPLKDLQHKIELFKSKIVSVRKERDRFSYLLTGELTSLERWINEEIEQFKHLETNRLKSRLSDWIECQQGITGREFLDESQQTLSDSLIVDFDAWRRTFEPKLIAKYEKIATEFIAEINGIVDVLRQISGGLFDIRIEPFSDIETLSWKKTFIYDVEDGALFFEIEPLKLTAGVLPKRVLRKKVQKNMIKEAEEKVERNSGRLRYEYSYSLQESARKLRADLDTELERIIEGIEHILQQAVQHKEESERDLRSQIEMMRDRIPKLKMLEQELMGTP